MKKRFDDEKKIKISTLLYGIAILTIFLIAAVSILAYGTQTEIGDKIADSIIDYFSKKENKELIERFKSAELLLEINETEINPLSSNKLEGKSFVVSGVFAHFSRDAIKESIELNGGKNVSAISAKTDYVVAGDKMGPEKLKKAEKLGIKIITEEEYIEMVK